jgi:hypothetical protein
MAEELATAADAAASPAEPEFVTAEAIPDPPSPFAFGLKALMAVMVIVSVQFALMSYLGPMAGLIVGIALCALTMTGLLVAAVVMGLKPGSGLMEQFDRIAIRLVFGIIVLFFGSIIAGGGVVLFTVLEDVRLAWRTQERLGFAYQERSMYDGNGFVTVLAVTKVEPGGAFGLAGVQAGDAVVLQTTAKEFLQMLQEQSGKSVDINVAVGVGNTPTASLENANIDPVTVRVP